MTERFFNTLFQFLLLFLIVRCSSSDNSLDLAPDQHALASIRSIYLGDFGRAEGADLVREKLRMRLIKSERFNVVEAPEHADAILTGSVGVEKHLDMDEGTTRYRGLGLLRLVDTKTQKTIWAHEYQRGLVLGESVSTRVADQMADKLLEDAGHRR